MKHPHSKLVSPDEKLKVRYMTLAPAFQIYCIPTFPSPHLRFHYFSTVDYTSLMI